MDGVFLWVTLGLALAIVVIAIFAWVAYNRLVAYNVRVDEAWSDITVQLKRRADLIPSLIETVKGYASHEKSVFKQVTLARAASIGASGVAEAAAADNQLQAALKSIFAVAEAYPQLQASQNFLDLQAQLTDTENKIQASRRFYNGGVRDLNTLIGVFPSNIVARIAKLSTREFFDVERSEALQSPPKIVF